MLFSKRSRSHNAKLLQIFIPQMIRKIRRKNESFPTQDFSTAVTVAGAVVVCYSCCDVVIVDIAAVVTVTTIL